LGGADLGAEIMDKITGTLFAGALLGVGLGLPVPAAADGFQYTWNVRGQMEVNGRLVGVSPVCVLRQMGNQISGFCKGPAAEGPATGVANGDNITWQWTATATNSNGRDGIAVFRGSLGYNGVIRGYYTNSTIPGVTGSFTAQ
jgi:hypothetical protein